MSQRLLEALEAARHLAERAGHPTYTALDGSTRVDAQAGAKWAALAAAKFAELAKILEELAQARRQNCR